jgi:hypothetical protein
MATRKKSPAKRSEKPKATAKKTAKKTVKRGTSKRTNRVKTAALRLVKSASPKNKKAALKAIAASL